MYNNSNDNEHHITLSHESYEYIVIRIKVEAKREEQPYNMRCKVCPEEYTDTSSSIYGNIAVENHVIHQVYCEA